MNMETLKIPTGTKLWQLAARQPQPGIFHMGDTLAMHAQAYFKWCDDNPRYTTQVIKHKMMWDVVDIPLKRMYTMSGICAYLGVTQGYLRQTRADLMETAEAGKISQAQLHVLATIEWIYQIIFTDQIEGAAAGQYTAQTVANLNGLTQNVNVTNTPDPVLRIVTRDAETTSNLNLLTASL